MPTITSRKRANGSTAYRAEVRIKRGGKLVYQESRTFDRKALAKDWGQRRELELQEPGALEAVRHRGVTVGALLKRYREEFGASFGRSKIAHIEMMQTFDLADLDAIELTAAQLIAHVVERRKTVAPATANNDLVWLRVVFRTARSAWGVPVQLSAIDDASLECRRQRLTARSRRRERRPTLAELDRLLEHFNGQDGRATIPMVELTLFALFSGRREEEICTLEWVNLDERLRSCVVRDMKHPREKVGNDVRIFFTDEAWAIIQRQPRDGERIFPFNPKSVGGAFTKAVRFNGIEDLHFHDLRHECISWMFERGWDIPRVASVSGHKSWGSLQRYTHLRQQEPYDKYEGFMWRPKLKKR